MPSNGAILLCGGQSSRMGRPKAWLPWRGQPMAAHVAGVLAKAVDEVVVVSSAALDPPPLPRGIPARVVRDETPGLGPLAGIAVGLAALETDLAFVTSTDAPWLDPALITSVLTPGRAAAPVLEGFVQVLAAAYPRDAAALARTLLADGARRPLALLEALDFRALSEADLPSDVATTLRGFNTPADYLAAINEDAQHAPVAVELVGRPRMLAGCDAFDAKPGTLRDVLLQIPQLGDEFEIVRGDSVASPFLVSLGGRDFVRDTRIPIGPGERVIVLDASAGG